MLKPQEVETWYTVPVLQRFASLFSPHQIAQTAPYPTVHSGNLRSQTFLRDHAWLARELLFTPPPDEQLVGVAADEHRTEHACSCSNAPCARIWHVVVTGWCQKGHENDAHGAQHARPDKALHHAAEWVRFFLFFLHEPGPPAPPAGQKFNLSPGRGGPGPGGGRPGLANSEPAGKKLEQLERAQAAAGARNL